MCILFLSLSFALRRRSCNERTPSARRRVFLVLVRCAHPAIVVLGCRVCLDHEGRLVPGALARRLDAGARTYLRRADPRTVVIVSGGRRWGSVVEADVMARELVIRGVPPRAIVRERCSLSTRENARFTAEVLGRRGTNEAAIVTSAWHMPRAVVLFSRAGVIAEPVEVSGGEDGRWPTRLLRWGVERVLTRV
jgi:uncharacterized SAM-binding protein YcdF (DUF218 family)